MVKAILGYDIMPGMTIEAYDKWLREIQAALKQINPEYTDQWLYDLLSRGTLAESAWDGFLKARKLGTLKIKRILKDGYLEKETDPVMR